MQSTSIFWLNYCNCNRIAIIDKRVFVNYGNVNATYIILLVKETITLISKYLVTCFKFYICLHISLRLYVILK